MKLQQIVIDIQNEKEVVFSSPEFSAKKADLVFAFGEREFLESSLPYNKLKDLYPNAQIVICSTSGQISNSSFVESKMVSTAIEF